MCEMEKMALGSETGYFFCDEPRVTSYNILDGNIVTIKKGTRIRRLYIRFSDEEHESWRRLIWKQLTLKSESLPGTGFSGAPGSVEVCAYPGGCD